MEGTLENMLTKYVLREGIWFIKLDLFFDVHTVRTRPDQRSYDQCGQRRQ